MGAFQCENTVFFSRSFLETPTQNCDSWACFVEKWTFWVLECGDFWDSLMKFGCKNIAGSQNQVQLVPPWYPPLQILDRFFFGDLDQADLHRTGMEGVTWMIWIGRWTQIPRFSGKKNPVKLYSCQNWREFIDVLKLHFFCLKFSFAFFSLCLWGIIIKHNCDLVRWQVEQQALPNMSRTWGFLHPGRFIEMAIISEEPQKPKLLIPYVLQHTYSIYNYIYTVIYSTYIYISHVHMYTHAP